MTKYSNSKDFDIPDNVMEVAHKGYVLEYGNIQSLERIKARGGFGIQEIMDFISTYLNKK